jgi:probable F420-dependent oxidoreductase
VEITVVRPFRFGGGLFWAGSAAEWADGARRLEADGYATLLIADHFSRQFAPVPALLAAASATHTLRVGCTVFDNDFRHPASLAMEVATADILSGGRFELGIGAGWNKSDYDKVGLPFDSPATRVNRFEEAVRVIKGLWQDGPLDFHGAHYTISGYDGQPKPLQHPHPPIFIGGGGKRLLSVAAREADTVGILSRAKPGGGLDPAEETDASVTQKIGWVNQAAGDRFAHLELASLIQAVVVTDNPRDAAEVIASRSSRPVEQILQSPYHLIGTVDAIVDTLLEQRQRYGFSYYSVFPSDTATFAPVVARLAGK